MRTLRLAPILALLALCVTTPALADLTFTFDSNQSFLPQAGVQCNTSESSSNYNLNCVSPYTLSQVYGTETLTMGQTRYYYLGWIQEDESDDDIDPGESALGTRYLRVTFSTSQETGFALDVPVALVGGTDDIRIDTRGVVQYLDAGSEGAGLFAQVRLTATNPGTLPTNGSATGLASCPSCINPSYYDYDTDDEVTRYYYLQLTYNTPEPATYVLIGSALLGLAFLKRKRRA